MDIDARRLLALLHRGGAWAYLWTVTGDRKRTIWYDLDNPAPLPTGPANVYFGIHPTARVPDRWKDGKAIPPEFLRATIPDIAAVNCLFGEFDAKDWVREDELDPAELAGILAKLQAQDAKLTPDKARVMALAEARELTVTRDPELYLPRTLAHIDGLAVAPSAVICSGGGYHAYWFLRDTWPMLEQADRERARELQAAWVAYVGSDGAAKDLARVLRVPGTVNRKYDPPRPVAMLRADYDRLYNLADLANVSRPAERPAPAPRGGNGRNPTEDDGAYWLDKALARVVPHAGELGRNPTGFWLACQLRDAGLSETAAETVMLTYAARVPQGGAPYTEREALASNREAYQKTPRDEARALGATPQRARGNGASSAPPAGDPGQQPDAEPPAWLEDGAQDLGAAGAPETQAKTPRKRITSGDLIDFLTARGYTFRLNLADDSVEVNGERISDVFRAQMRTKLRDAGLGKYLAAAEDAVTAYAAQKAYHPVRDYLEGLTWDGRGHIAQLAGHVTDTNGVFGLYLRKWLIGAVARAYTGTQNAVLVLDGPQGLGKSQLVRWLCPLPKLFVDAGVNPDDKDCSLLAIRAWLWEVSELGATTKRADVEALKGFLSREVFTLRPAYGHYEIVKPGLASFVGTVNNSSGIFSDPTGSRRYWATTLTTIAWSYAEHVDKGQLWAEAYAAYKAGEAWTLTGEEAEAARAINEGFSFADPVEDLLRKFYTLDPARADKWTPTVEILTTLQANGLGASARANAMYLSATLKRLGFVAGRRGFIRGYAGIW